MELLELHWQIWAVRAPYFIGILLTGWWNKKDAHSQEEKINLPFNEAIPHERRLLSCVWGMLPIRS